jgi:hypothetical protein
MANGRNPETGEPQKVRHRTDHVITVNQNWVNQPVPINYLNAQAALDNAGSLPGIE